MVTRSDPDSVCYYIVTYLVGERGGLAEDQVVRNVHTQGEYAGDGCVEIFKVGQR
jgi:hypothetical protein